MPITTDEIINLCKNNLEEANKVMEKNKYSWFKTNIFDFQLQLYKNIIHKYVIELDNDILNLLFEKELIDPFYCFMVCCKNGDLELIKFISKMSNLHIWDYICYVVDEFDLQSAKIMFEVIPEVFYEKIYFCDDYILCSLCDYFNKYQPFVGNGEKMIRGEEANKRLQFIKWILEEVKPDYNLATINVIRDAIIHDKNGKFQIAKYLTEYIEKRGEIKLQTKNEL
jgi:hypothetical protein